MSREFVITDTDTIADLWQTAGYLVEHARQANQLGNGLRYDVTHNKINRLLDEMGKRASL